MNIVKFKYKAVKGNREHRGKKKEKKKIKQEIKGVRILWQGRKASGGKDDDEKVGQGRKGII